MKPTKEQIEEAREALGKFSVIQDGNKKWIRGSMAYSAYETILSCLTPPEPAASEGGVDKKGFEIAKRLWLKACADLVEANKKIDRFEADRKLAVEALKPFANVAEQIHKHAKNKA